MAAVARDQRVMGYSGLTYARYIRPMPPNVLVIIVDGLRASALGAYGNTSFPTPIIDRLAAESLLVEWCYSPSADLPDIYSALWNSRAADADSDTNSLPLLLAKAGYATTLVTDDASLTSLPPTNDFSEMVAVDNSIGSRGGVRRADIAETELARTFAAATDQFAAAPPKAPRLLWVHTRAMYGPWDAPASLQQTLLDDDDTAPIDSNPPDIIIGDGDDPDLAFRYGCAYAAQVMVLDECLGQFFEILEANVDDEWVVILLGARGFPLGEHRKIGGADPRMYAEQLHVPWLIRFPDGRGRLTRVPALASHHDLAPTLAEIIGLDHKLGQQAFEGYSVIAPATARRVPSRQAAISASSSARSIRTASWCLREDAAQKDSAVTANETTAASELYVRPDDRWEANDVAKLCPDVVEELRASFPSC